MFKALIVVLVLSLSACGGGGSSTPSISVTVSGLATGSQVVLSDSTVVTTNGTFTTTSSIVSISEQPYNQTCNVTQTSITCTNLAVPYQSNGFVVPMWSYTNHADTLQSLTTLKRNTKANTIIVDFHLTTSGINGNDISIQNPNLVAGLKDVLQTAKSLGLDVWFKPVVIVGANGNNWQDLAPTDPQLWFTNYGAALNQLADTISPYHTSHFLITNELRSMTTNPAYSGYWNTLTTNLRQHYSGKLGFNAGGLLGTCGNCNEFLNIPGDTLNTTDFVGISAYPRVLTPQAYTIDNVASGWTSDIYGTNLKSVVNNFIDAHPTFSVFFTELGSPAMFGGNANPSASYDPLSQQNFYDSSLSEITTSLPKLDGTFIYDWLLHVDTSAIVDNTSPLAWDIYSKATTQSAVKTRWTIQVPQQ
jgi:hypothetical protein